MHHKYNVLYGFLAVFQVAWTDRGWMELWWCKSVSGQCTWAELFYFQITKSPLHLPYASGPLPLHFAAFAYPNHKFSLYYSWLCILIMHAYIENLRKIFSTHLTMESSIIFIARFQYSKMQLNLIRLWMTSYWERKQFYLDVLQW